MRDEGTRRRRTRGALRGAFAFALALVLTIAGAEVAVRLATGLDGERARAERSEFAGRIPGAGAAPEGGVTSRVVQMAYGSRFELHPYFGFTYARGDEGVNGQGFVTGGVEYPYEAAPDELVVGVFGGSVAMQVAERGEILEERLRPLAARRGYRSVRVLPFAGGAWRQPQTFHAFVHFLPWIDAAVVVDGFNEIIQLGDVNLATWPAAFPASEVYGALARDSAEDAARIGRLTVLHDAALRGTAAFDAPVVRSSVLAHLAWRALAARYADAARGLRASAKRDPSSGYRDPSASGDPAREREEYYARYEDLARAMHVLGAARGKPVFHFVQPNQYDRGAKPLSQQERDEYTSAGWSDHVTPAYDRLDAITRRLAESGVASRSLRHLFREETATMYSDPCCHLNDEGVRRLNDAIADAIERSGRLDDVPPAGARGRGAGGDAAPALLGSSQ